MANIPDYSNFQLTVESVKVISTEKACRGCNNCLKPFKKVKLCARCSAVRYCSQECQIADWPSHKQLCRSFLNDSFKRTKLVSDLVQKRIQNFEEMCKDAGILVVVNVMNDSSTMEEIEAELDYKIRTTLTQYRSLHEKVRPISERIYKKYENENEKKEIENLVEQRMQIVNSNPIKDLSSSSSSSIVLQFEECDLVDYTMTLVMVRSMIDPYGIMINYTEGFSGHPDYPDTELLFRAFMVKILSPDERLLTDIPKPEIQ